MNEIDLVAAVLLSSGAGYLLGKHYERKKAQAAFKSFQVQVIQATQRTTAGLMAVLKKRNPDVPIPELMQEIVNACKEEGVEVIAVNGETGHVVKSNDNKTQ